MPFDPERSPNATPAPKVEGISASDFIQTARAYNPDLAKGLSDEQVFERVLKSDPDILHRVKFKNLNIGQFANTVRILNPDIPNMSDFSIVEQSLKSNPGYYKRLDQEGRIKLGIVAGAETLPAIGAIAGGAASMAAAPGTAGSSLLGGSLLAGVGAATGEAGKQLLRRAVGASAPKTSGEAAGTIAEQGAYNAAINYIGGKAFEVAAKPLKPMVAQLMKGFNAVDERIGMKVLNDPDILLRAKPMKEAEKAFSDFFTENKYTYGDRAVKAATGKLALSDNAADDMISEVLSKTIEQPVGTPETIQQALAARFAVRDAIGRATRAGNDSKARLFIEGRNEIDDWLENQLPGFKDVRKMYEEAKIKETFSSFLPKNKNGQASVLRAWGSVAGGLAAGAAGNPVLGAAGALAVSPMTAGTLIKGAAIASKYPTRAAASALATEGLVRFRKQKKTEATDDTQSDQIAATIDYMSLSRQLEPYADIPDERIAALAESGDINAMQILSARNRISELQQKYPGIENTESIANIAGTAAMVAPAALKTIPTAAKSMGEMLKSERGAVDFTPMTEAQANYWLKEHPAPIKGISKQEATRIAETYNDFHKKRLMGLSEGYKETFTPEALKAKKFLDNNLHESYKNIIDEKDKSLFIYYGVSPFNKVISKIEQELGKLGWNNVHTSTENGIPTSRYLEKDGTRIRISNHDVPQTAERNMREAEGRQYWDKDYVYHDKWLKQSPQKIAQEIDAGTFNL